MPINHREWVNDLVTGAVSGAVEGVIVAMLVPEPPYLEALAIGGVIGLVVAMLQQPLRALLNKRPRPDDNSEDDDHDD